MLFRSGTFCVGDPRRGAPVSPALQARSPWKSEPASSAGSSFRRVPASRANSPPNAFHPARALKNIANKSVFYMGAWVLGLADCGAQGRASVLADSRRTELVGSGTRALAPSLRNSCANSPAKMRFSGVKVKDKTLEALSLSCRFGRRREIATGDCRPPNLHELLKKAKTSQSEVCKTFTLVS